MWNSGLDGLRASAPTLTMGAVEALHKHASGELKQTYLAKLVSGEWTGTMNLTEPQAGSDLGALRTRAERAADGTYRIFGQKIFITYGEHDFTDNIVPSGAGAPTRRAGRHARHLAFPGAEIPGGRRRLARRAATIVFCASLEHKLGIHGSPTCTMVYGDGFVAGDEKGAVGWLIGEENKGLACMFTMMNNARLAIGLRRRRRRRGAPSRRRWPLRNERRQGKAPGLPAQRHGRPSSLIRTSQRMLLDHARR